MRPQEAAPAERERRNRPDHDPHGEREPGDAGVPEHVDRRAEVDLPDEVRDRRPREQERADDAGGSSHAWARTSSVRSSYATFAAAIAVGWPGPSYGGLTSTTSKPEKRSPRSART